MKKNKKDRFKSVQVPQLRAAIKGIMGMFIWEHSAEGHEYWQKIVERLEALAKKYEADQ